MIFRILSFLLDANIRLAVLIVWVVLIWSIAVFGVDTELRDIAVPTWIHNIRELPISVILVVTIIFRARLTITTQVCIFRSISLYSWLISLNWWLQRLIIICLNFVTSQFFLLKLYEAVIRLLYFLFALDFQTIIDIEYAIGIQCYAFQSLHITYLVRFTGAHSFFPLVKLFEAIKERLSSFLRKFPA